MLTVDPTLFQETSNANDGKLRRERPKFVNKSPLIFSLNFAFFSVLFSSFSYSHPLLYFCRMFYKNIDKYLYLLGFFKKIKVRL